MVEEAIKPISFFDDESLKDIQRIWFKPPSLKKEKSKINA